jgi:precorrin-2 dehydrogenase/sirohydrochlorin ferrochelatase
VASSSISAPLYPLSLRVAGRACVVVGGGTVAARKVGSLVAAGAAVTVVAPELGEQLTAEHAGDPGWFWIARAFEPEDCAGCLLLVAATADREVNRRAAEAGRAAGALVNVVDDPEGSDFVVPSVVRRGPLQIAVSTAGLAPAFSASLRRRLEHQFPPEYGQAVEVVAQSRADARAAGSGEPERRALAHRLAALDLLALLEEGGLECVRAAVRAARETGT